MITIAINASCNVPVPQADNHLEKRVALSVILALR